MFLLPSRGTLFPHPLAVEGDIVGVTKSLNVERLQSAYLHGIFPWYNEGEPVLWWFPKPRAVLFPSKLRVHKSMRNVLNRRPWRVSWDRAFAEVIRHCAVVPRKGQRGTWITEEIQAGYIQLHHLGWAHSVEVWEGDALVGGLYGVLVGRVFFGESMFSLRSNASKYALIHMVRHLERRGLILIDVQQDTAHLRSLGAEVISAERFHHFMRQNRRYWLRYGSISFE